MPRASLPPGFSSRGGYVKRARCLCVQTWLHYEKRSRIRVTCFGRWWSSVMHASACVLLEDLRRSGIVHHAYTHTHSPKQGRHTRRKKTASNAHRISGRFCLVVCEIKAKLDGHCLSDRGFSLQFPWEWEMTGFMCGVFRLVGSKDDTTWFVTEEFLRRQLVSVRFGSHHVYRVYSATLLYCCKVDQGTIPLNMYLPGFS